MRLGLRDLQRAKMKFGVLGGALAPLVFLVLFLNTLSITLLGFFTAAGWSGSPGRSERVLPIGPAAPTPGTARTRSIGAPLDREAVEFGDRGKSPVGRPW